MVELIKKYNKWFNLQYQIIYFYNVYGPRQIYNSKYSTAIAIFEEQKKNNQKLTVVRPGTQKRNFTHIYDVLKKYKLKYNINAYFDGIYYIDLKTKKKMVKYKSLGKKNK